MKRIKIIIEDIPNDYVRPELIRYNTTPLKLADLSDLETLTVNEPDKEYYRHELFGYGKSYKEGFYIMPDQKKAFEGVFHGFIRLARINLLHQIKDDIYRYNLHTIEGVRMLLEEILEKEISPLPEKEEE